MIKNRGSMSEFSENVCVMDVVPMSDDELLFINEAEFKPFEKLSEMRGGRLGLLTGMILDELRKEQTKRLLSKKIEERLKHLTRRGFMVKYVHKEWIRYYYNGFCLITPRD